MFPPRSPGAGGSQLDGPPPSPTPMDPAGGGNTPLSMRGLAPQIPANQMPPEILTGLLQAGQTIGQMLDSFSQVLPDKSAQFALIKDLLQQVFADVVSAGAGATSPTAAGPAFPGGGIDRGIAGPGSV